MLFALNHIKETMYYWGDNYKMQTSHTLCSRPKRYGALQARDHGGRRDGDGRVHQHDGLPTIKKGQAPARRFGGPALLRRREEFGGEAEAA